MKQVKRTRNLEKTRAHILQIAFGQIFRCGFQGVSVDDIVKETGLTKGAFYHHFPTKLDLGYAIVDEVIHNIILSRWIQPLADHKNPIEGIPAQLKKIIDETPDAKVELGCPLNNLCQEMSTVDAVFQAKLSAQTHFWLAEMEAVLVKAKADGFLRENVNTRELAEFIVTIHEGMYAMGKIYKDKSIWYSLYRSLKEHLELVRT